MKNIIQERDWSQTSLGAIKEWPEKLKSALDICMGSNTAISIFWGREYLHLYNNAWKKIFREEHSKTFGRPAKNSFGENWPEIKPLLEKVSSTGIAADFKNFQMPFSASGSASYNLSLSAIIKENNSTYIGIFCIAIKNSAPGEPKKYPPDGNHSFRKVLDSLPAAIYTTDADGYLTYYNPSAVKFSGHTPELGSDQWCVSWKLYYPDGTPMPHEECPMAVSIKKGVSLFGKQAIAERPDGKRIHFEAYPSPLHDKNGNITGGINMLLNITKRKEAEIQLRQNKKYLADFFQNAAIGIHWVGPDGIIVNANRAELDMLGYSADEYIGSHIAEHHADKKLIDSILQKLSEGEELHNYEARLRCKDGSIRHVIINSNVLWEDGKFVHTRCVTRDVTDQKKTRKALQKSEKKYRMLFDSMDEGFCIIKMIFDENEKPVDYRFLEINPAFKHHTGFKNAVGKRMRELEPDHEDYWFDIFGKVALTGETVRFEQFAVAMKRYFDVYAFPFGKSENHQVAIFFNDITQRKENEYTNAWLGALIEGSEDAIISKNLEGVITSWNSSAEKLFGYSSEEAVGRNIKIIIPENRIYEEEEILRKLKRGENIKQYETIREHKNGNLLNISLTISPIRNAAGEVVGVSKIARDITQQKKINKQLREMTETLEKRVDQRTADLQSYQNQLRSLASRLNKTEEDERHRLATELHNNLGQMLAVAKIKINFLDKDKLPVKTAIEISELSDLINDALGYTRELMLDLKPPPVLNNEDIGEVLEWLAEKMEKYDLKVNLKNDGIPKPLGKEVRRTLHQCVQELLFNVIKHSGVKEAGVTVLREKNMIHIIVTDEGNGFDMNDKQPEPTKDGGFGLFNIYEQLDFLGGKFKIVSKPGKGTRATLSTPLEVQYKIYTVNENSSNNLQYQQTMQSEQMTLFQTIKVLLVDDHEMVRRGFREMIEGEKDMTIVGEASNGEDALRLTPEILPDIIVMDVNLPGMNGIEATRRILDGNQSVKVIGLSLHDQEKVIRDMQNAGASAYLTKDEAFETLCAVIRREANH